MDRGMPILYMQQALRKLSYYYPIFRVIPTGVYDKNTRLAVLDFQKYFNIIQTGRINNELYEKIDAEYIKVLIDEEKENNLSKQFSFSEGESGDIVGIFQILNNFLSNSFTNIKLLEINYLMDEYTVNAVKVIQTILNIKDDGILNNEVFIGLKSIINGYF